VPSQIWFVEVEDAVTASEGYAFDYDRSVADAVTAADVLEWVRHRTPTSDATASDAVSKNHSINRSLYGYGYVDDVVSCVLRRPIASTCSASDSVTTGKTIRAFHVFMHEGGDISFSAVVSGTMTYDLDVRLQAVI
jgi:hypothetical protein